MVRPVLLAAASLTARTAAARRALGVLAALLAAAIVVLPGAQDGLGPAPLAAQVPISVGDGPPPAWQQGVEYRMEVELDEAAEVLRGRARVRYRNNSPHRIGEFWFHLHLNAFRPNSAWARTDLEAGIRTFQDLGPEEHAFERIGSMEVEGRPVALFYPHAPDSTVVRLELPDSLGPGESITLDYTWEARPSTVPRRQGRRDRQWDFAQWYPRVVVYDDEGWRPHPLYRQGEFHGEFATYDVTMEVRDDQVVGATGVPVEGDPGWGAAAAPGHAPADLHRAWYGTLSGPPCVERRETRICGEYPARNLAPAEPLGFLEGAPPDGRRRVRWRAENVHHFAWSTSPEYVYEGGEWEGVPIHVLYRPGDEESWGGGVAVERTATALAWMDTIFGPYPYPQVTNLHRIESGGTEFPMLIMDGSASQGLILHEVGHIYAHGILANNEWYEGWLDEGMSTFQTSWFFEEQGAGDAVWRGARIGTLALDLRGWSEPVVMPAEDYAEYGVYGAMIYTKGAVVLWMLRELAGEEDFRAILRTYFERYRFRHVDSDALKGVAEEVMRQDLDWFFGQWLHATGVVDYALAGVDVRRGEGGESWTTVLELERKGDLVMPVPVRLTAADGTARTVRVDGWERENRLSVVTAFEPTEVEIDPDGTILDWNVANNAWPSNLVRWPNRDVGLDNPLRPLPTRWREVPVRLFPLAWMNDAGGWVAGLQLRSVKLGFVDDVSLRWGLPSVEAGGRGGGAGGTDLGSLWMEARNPVAGGGVDLGSSLELFAGEGRALVRLATERRFADRPLTDPLRALGGSLTVYAVDDPAYLVAGRWDPREKVGVEAGLSGTAELRSDAAGFRLTGRASGGLTTRDQRYVRGSVTATGSYEPGRWALRGRFFMGGATGRSVRDVEPFGDDEATEWDGRFVPPERRFFLSGAGPFETISNPWLRSEGALLDEEGRVPGGGNLPGFRSGFGAPGMVALGLEVAGPGAAWSPWEGAELEARPLAFGGLAVTGGQQDPSGGVILFDGAAAGSRLDPGRIYWSAGVGVETGFADSPLRLRFEVPFLISDPALATEGLEDEAALRWSLGIVVR